jgi:hypothetical protein
VYGTPSGYLVLGGGQCTDTATGLSLSVPLTTPWSCSVLSPLTTLVSVLKEVRRPSPPASPAREGCG